MIARPCRLLFSVAAILLGLLAAAGAEETPAAGVHQLRIYEVPTENIDVFHARFRDHALRIMSRYGFDILAMWQSDHEGKTEFVYLLAWPDEETMKKQWAAFLADEEWIAIKQKTAAVHGDFVNAIEDRTLMLTDYSPQLPAAKP